MLDKALAKQKALDTKQKLSEGLKSVSIEALKAKTQYKWLCWFLTFLYIIFIVVVTFIKFDTQITYYYGDGHSFTVTAEQNLMSLWSATTPNPNLKGIKLYALLFGMGLVSILIDLILIKFVWGTLFSPTQHLINKQAKIEKEALKQNIKEHKEYKKEMKALQRFE